MSSFPASKYSRYKRATAFFLDWLLRARDHGRHTGKRMQLETLSVIAKDIAADPSSLTPNLLQELHKALAAWDGGRATTPGPGRAVRSYYDILQVDEDYFPDEDTGFGASGVPKRAKADRKRLFEEAFAEDLKLELVCYFLELEELVEGVFDVYDQVKKQQHTLVEATVAKVAMNTVSSMTAQLQLKYPALKTAEDVFTLLREQIPERVQKRVSNAVTAARQKFEEGTPFTHVPGMLLIDFENVLYPSSSLVILIAQQLPMLYNAYVDRVNHTGSGFDQFGLVSSFMKLTEDYFKSRKASVEAVMTCVFWMKSVVALQGNA
ncbi:hypothetical protein PHYSODRAFT_264117, partial [Phytophthora sojae]